jgi:hypothetical protein
MARAKRPNRQLSSKENPVRRTSLEAGRNIINVSGISEDKQGRWVNDVDNRINEMKDRGYEFVPASEVDIGDRSVDSSEGVGEHATKNMGGGVTAYFMVQRKEWYEEDRAFKQNEVDRSEASLRNQPDNPLKYGKVDVGFNK